MMFFSCFFQGKPLFFFHEEEQATGGGRSEKSHKKNGMKLVELKGKTF